MAKSIWVENEGSLEGIMLRGYVPVWSITLEVEYEPFMSKAERDKLADKLEVKALRIERRLHELLAQEDAVVAIVRKINFKWDVWKKGTRRGRYRIVAITKKYEPELREKIVVLAKEESVDRIVELIRQGCVDELV